MSYLIKQTPNSNIPQETKMGSDTMCRVCMSTRSQMLPIFGLDPKDTFDERIMRSADVKVQSGDGLPTTICTGCVSLLKSAVQFRDWCEYSDRVLREVLANSARKTHLLEANKEIDSEKDFAVNVNDESSISSQNGYMDEDDWSLPTNDVQIPVKINKTKINSSIISSDGRVEDPANESPQVPLTDPPKRTRRTRGETLSASPPKRRFQPVICEVCGVVLKQEHSLKDHMLIHQGALPFQCTLCPHRSRLAWSLKIHMRAHAGERPFACAKCPRKFLTSSNRKKHLVTHELEKPFKCDVCEKMFSYKHTLEDHVATAHVGYKRHHCQICNDRFQSRKSLRKHQRKKHSVVGKNIYLPATHSSTPRRMEK